jgi:segregation and condensation protein B
MTLKQVIEALVFASQKPLIPKEISGLLRSAANETGDLEARALAKAKEAEIGAALEELKAECIELGRSFQLVERASGWQFVTVSDFGPWVRELYPESRPARLSGPALETLAIIAYRQPATRAEIEGVRGVAVDGIVQTLLEKGLIRIAGRAEVPGRPLLYETTQVFLEHFGLRELDELPNSTELRRIPIAPAPEQSELPMAEIPEGATDAPPAPATDVPGTAPAEEAPAQPDSSPETAP